MNRSFLNILALLLLAGGVLLGIRVLKPGKTEGPATKPAAVRRGTDEPTRPPVAPVLIRKLLDPSLHPAERIEAVRALPTDLSERELTELMALLRRPPPERISASTWYMLLNEVMEVLRQPRFQWAGYGGAMGGLVVDRHVDPVVRDYAAQHLSLWLGAATPAQTDNAFDRGMEAFLTVLRGEREAFESVTGTTFMALCDLHTKRAGLGSYDAELGTIITAYIAGDRPASLSNRISAIQAAGRMDHREALPAIRGFATRGAANPSIRLSSIAALGYFSDPADQPFLRDLAQSNNRLRFAAREALRNYER